MGKLDIFMFSLIFIILGWIFGILLYIYGWYDCTTGWIGLVFVFVPTGYSCYLLDKIFPSPYSKKWTLNGIIITAIGMIIGIFCLVGYLKTKDYIEESELKNHGIERIGIIQNYNYRKSGGYYVVNFKTTQNESKSLK